MDDASVMIIINSEGCQQGNPVAQFVFSLAEGPVLMAIFPQIRCLDNQCGLVAIHDDNTAVVPTIVASDVCHCRTGNSIVAVPRESHLYPSASNLEQVSCSLHSDIQVHNGSQLDKLALKSFNSIFHVSNPLLPK